MHLHFRPHRLSIEIPFPIAIESQGLLIKRACRYCFNILSNILHLFIFDRLDFAKEQNLVQWIRRLSQQIKALVMLRDQESASKCKFFIYTATYFLKDTEYSNVFSVFLFF